jgi:DNA-3-methyladenine glycosylase II
VASSGWVDNNAPAGALDHLRAADPVMARLLDELGPDPLRSRSAAIEPSDHYGALVSAITGQQLSGRAARAIYTRLTARFGNRPPTPREILDEDPEELRAAAGLSRAKTASLRSLAEHVLDGRLELERLDDLPDDLVMEELVAVKGIGPWTAEMFLLFHLRRPDILSPGDLGIRKAVMRYYELDELPDAPTLQRIAEPWRPHRSTACRILWRALDGPDDVF